MERVQKIAFSEHELRQLAQALSIAREQAKGIDRDYFAALAERVDMALEVIDYRNRADELSKDLEG